MFRIIRLGSEYGLVVAVTPAEAKPGDEQARFFCLTDWQVGDRPANTFCEVSRTAAECYFSGHSDGCGWESPPERTFGTLQELQEFVTEKQNLAAATRLRELTP